MSFVFGTLFGLTLFPILFIIQKNLGLHVPDLKIEKYHVHHSFWGLILLIFGILMREPLVIGMGIGFIVHHEYSEPGLKGIGKFVYINKKYDKKRHN